MIFFRQRGPLGRGGKKPGPEGEKAALKTYEERMDEITRWNVEHTGILEVLRGEIQEERLLSWSKALGIGIRKVAKGPAYSGRSQEYEALRDLDQFIAKQRVKLLGNPAMREAKGIERMDSLSVCIICGIRALQKERGLPGMMNTMKLKLLERYLGGISQEHENVQRPMRSG
jgi:hypothetical protein